MLHKVITVRVFYLEDVYDFADTVEDNRIYIVSYIRVIRIT